MKYEQRSDTNDKYDPLRLTNFRFASSSLFGRLINLNSDAYPKTKRRDTIANYKNYGLRMEAIPSEYQTKTLNAFIEACPHDALPTDHDNCIRACTLKPTTPNDTQIKTNLNITSFYAK